MFALNLKSRNDPFLNLVHLAIEGGGEALLTGTFIIDWFPIRKTHYFRFYFLKMSYS